MISGIVLLALTQVPRLLDQMHYWLEERTGAFYFYTSNVDDFIIAALKGCTYWLMAGIILHLVLRSVWVSFVGLSYVFPKGVQAEKLKLRPWFEERIKALPSFEASVTRLENVCSAVYATAFLFVMATLGFCTYMIVILGLVMVVAQILPPEMLRDDSVLDLVVSGFTLVVAVPYMIDFLTLGWVKRIPWFWRVYRYPYRFMSAVTFAPVYRGIYYGLISNINRWKLFFLLLFFFVVNLFIVAPSEAFFKSGGELVVSQLEVSVIDGYYRDQSPNRYSTRAHIQSELIREGGLQVFLPHKLQYEKMILEICPQNLKAKGIEDDFDFPGQRNLACMSSFYSFRIDTVEVQPTQFYFREMTSTAQVGLTTWIDLKGFERGMHALEVYENTFEGSFMRAHIPFFFDAP